MVTSYNLTIEYFGLEDDDKPIEGVLNGSKFTEIDTGDVYLFDEENGSWIAQGA